MGTRPEAIKLAPVIHALAARGTPPTIVFTGQHPQLAAADYGLAHLPAVELGCRGQDDPHAHVERAAGTLAPLLATAAPELVVVQGDTSSALGGAIAASRAGIALAHVEAGLRSHNRRQPWPEEAFRIAIDGQSDLLFAPTELSAANLRRERVRGEIHVTGNSGVDALLATRTALPPRTRDRATRRLLVTCHRRENWEQGISELAVALRAIAAARLADVDIVLHPNPALAAQVRKLIGGRPGVALHPPCSHQEMLTAIMDADLLLTDSGGLQEEAAVLGVPLLILREATERPEAIACGSAELVGTRAARIVAAVERRLSTSREAPPALPFGDGRAGERIAAIVHSWLMSDLRAGRRAAPDPRRTAV